MANHDQYIVGPRNFWIHFLCGLVLGIVISAPLSVQLFESGSFIILGTGVGSLLIAYACAQWGDSVWHWAIRFIKNVPWIP